MSEKPTPLLKALFQENRLPFRYKYPFIFTYQRIRRFLGYNLNTKKHWDKELSKEKGLGEERYKNIIKFLPKNKKFSLLDIGCALGEGCVLLKKEFPNAKIEGCDFSSIAIEKAKKTKNINFFVLDILKKEIPKKYDYILSISVFEHFRNPEKIIKKCLKQTNTLILDCPYNEKVLGKDHMFSCRGDTFKEFNSEIRIYGNRITYIIKTNL